MGHVIVKPWHLWYLEFFIKWQLHALQYTVPTEPNLPRNDCLPCVTGASADTMCASLSCNRVDLLITCRLEMPTSLDKLAVVFLGSLLAFFFETFHSSTLLTCMWVVPLSRLLLGSRQQTAASSITFGSVEWGHWTLRKIPHH